MFNVFIRIDFEDGYQLIVEKEKLEDYNNDFDCYISKHGNIVHLDMDITM